MTDAVLGTRPFGANAPTRGGALGPLIGSLLVSAWSWRAIFWFNVCLGAVALVIAFWAVPKSSDPVGARFDPAGFVLGAFALSSVTFAIILGETHGYRSWWIDLLFGFAALATVGFAAVELHAANPVLDVRYFQRRAFTGSNIASFAVYCGTFAVFFMVALYLQVVVGVTPLGLAINFVPLAVGMVGSSLLTGRWVAAWGPRVPMATGCLLAGVGILLTNHLVTPHAGVHQIGWTLFIAGVGVGMAMVPVTSAVLGSVPAQHSGMASSTTNTFRELGAVVGVAVLGSIVNGQLTVNLVARLTAIGIPKAYQSVVVSAVTTGAYKSEAKRVATTSPAVSHIVNEVVSAAYSAFGHVLHLSLTIAGVLLLGSSVVALVTVYGRRVHFERIRSAEGHPMHCTASPSQPDDPAPLAHT